jgi:NAD(P)-dependent dehydrogenase (short-subunit alcohol dehydrogenase family)
MQSRPVVLVTGAARRLGRAIALDLARHGWQVALHYRGSLDEAQNTLQALQRAGAGFDATARAFQADLAVEDECEALLPAVKAAFGRVDAVVNNASLFELDDVASFSYAGMERHWRANTAPAIVLARALHAGLDAGRDGVVVNLLDQKLWNPNPDYLSYTLSKAALECATTLLAQALAPRLRVCGVAPGLTLGSELIDADSLARLQAGSPLKRGVAPDHVAQAVRFLLENPSVTGSTLLVDAGSHLAPAARDFAFQGASAPSPLPAAPARPATP